MRRRRREKKGGGIRITCLKSERDEYRFECRYYVHRQYLLDHLWHLTCKPALFFSTCPKSEGPQVFFFFWLKKLSFEKLLWSLSFFQVFFCFARETWRPPSPPDSRIFDCWLSGLYDCFMLTWLAVHLNMAGHRPHFMRRLWANSSSVCSLFHRHRLASIFLCHIW